MPYALTNLTLHLRLVGALLLLVAAMHAFMPSHFAWGVELLRLSPVNRQIFVSHTLFIVLLLILAGIFTFYFAPLLIERTALNRVLLAGMAILWLAKGASQIALFSAAKHRSGRFDIGTHILFLCLWTYIGGVYATAWLSF